MTHSIVGRGRRAACLLVLTLTLPVTVLAQSPGGAPVDPVAGDAPPAAPLPSVSVQESASVGGVESADRTKGRLDRLLSRYPPSLRQVIRLDPGLLVDANYLRPYPDLAAFLAEHPEVPRNPAYFVGRPVPDITQNAAVQIIENLSVLTGILTVVFVIAWLLKYVIDYTRWWRLAKAQTLTHARVVERLTSNEELLAYLQSPAGQRLIEPMPMGDRGAAAMAAPVGRILWSLQVGVIASLVGIGLLFLSRESGGGTIAAQLAEALPVFFVGGVVVLAAGLGFLVSAALCYVASRRLGLLSVDAGVAHA